MEQPEAVGRSLSFGARLSWEKVVLGGLEHNIDKLSKIQHMALAGCGSSLNAAKYGERIMKNLVSVPGRITSMDVVEAGYSDFACPKETSTTGLIAISQSGETSDVKRVVNEAQNEGVITMGVVNVVGSLVARATNIGVYCNAGQENGVASTKTFTSQVTVLALIALWFRELRDRIDGIDSQSTEKERLKEALLRLPISLGMALRTRDQCKEVAEKLKKKEHCFVLGKGANKIFFNPTN
jgi:glucosamine--fructose-6-phosphate aminotransferase (isomerizing)